MQTATTSRPEDLDLINNHVLPCLHGTKPFRERHGPNVLMGYTEIAYFEAILAQIKPQCAIEVGTETGATLAIIAKHAKKVVSIDIDPRVKTTLEGQFKNVVFITGSSHTALPEVLKRVAEMNTPIDFIFIDGDHSAEGVREDIEHVLNYRPKTRLVVMMHDSFNPECRRGILAADWQRSSYCHFVDVDFAPGVLHPDEPVRRQMWGGLGFALFLPTERKHELKIMAPHQLLYEAALMQSVYVPRELFNR
jgi:hypothetical protein